MDELKKLNDFLLTSIFDALARDVYKKQYEELSNMMEKLLSGEESNVYIEKNVNTFVAQITTEVIELYETIHEIKTRSGKPEMILYRCMCDYITVISRLIFFERVDGMQNKIFDEEYYKLIKQIGADALEKINHIETDAQSKYSAKENVFDTRIKEIQKSMNELNIKKCTIMIGDVPLDIDFGQYDKSANRIYYLGCMSVHPSDIPNEAEFLNDERNKIEFGILVLLLPIVYLWNPEKYLLFTNNAKSIINGEICKIPYGQVQEDRSK